MIVAEKAGFQVQADHPDAYILVQEGQELAALSLTQTLRQQGLQIALNCGGGSMKSQFKRAEKSGARHAIFLDQQHIEISFLHTARAKETIDINALPLFLKQGR